MRMVVLCGLFRNFECIFFVFKLYLSYLSHFKLDDIDRIVTSRQLTRNVFRKCNSPFWDCYFLYLFFIFQCCSCAVMFMFLISSSLLLSILTVAPLSSEDHLTVYRGIKLFGFGLVFFSSLFTFINYIGLETPVGTAFRKKFNLTAYDILDISNKYVKLR